MRGFVTSGAGELRVAYGKLVPRARLERATYGLGNRCSVQLSYRGLGMAGIIGQKTAYRQGERNNQ